MQVINLTKDELRKRYLLIRNKIENKEEKSKMITEKIINTEEYKKAKVIALYKNLLSEVDTSELINYSINMNKIVALPRVKENKMFFYKISSLKDTLIKSEFGIEEPVEDKINLMDITNIDLVIVPGICFDREKNRLGFGKGYYDRVLSKINVKTIAICFSKQILEKKILPTNNNDIKMQQIITEKEILI